MKRKGLLVDYDGWHMEVLNDGEPITCEVSGELADGTKCWYNIEDLDENGYPDLDAYWHSLRRIDGEWFFIIEGK